MARNSTPWAEIRAELLANPKVKEAYDALEPAYQLARLRIAKGLTQEELAERSGLKQPNIARMETGKAAPTLDTLRRVAAAMGYRLDVRFVPAEEGQPERCAELVGAE